MSKSAAQVNRRGSAAVDGEDDEDGPANLEIDAPIDRKRDIALSQDSSEEGSQDSEEADLLAH